MGLLLKQLFSLIKLLNSETGENQIASGIAAGFILGMSPAFSLQSALVFLCFFLFRIQVGMAFLATFFFAFIAWLLDPIFHAVGSALLEAGPLQNLWTTLYNMPLVPYTRFNNSVTMGAGVVAIALSPVIFILSKKLVKKYRASILERFKQTKLWKAVKATSLYNWYFTYDKYYGA
ncbi:MAG: TIGR03546 family protein [Proteobacteria bacterium]|nr:MAG: TIGR03546 family protein [Pseudomonadota bacterium]